ncbi:nucleoside deaminase [Polyangium fumosum]|uniref:nucleoside deaminase n=1 Tax=Polyangium fumosum TaxID=889272 RepID=UPI0014781B50|nr:nucleoside deaminase [Polyangium fumosum]
MGAGTALVAPSDAPASQPAPSNAPTGEGPAAGRAGAPGDDKPDPNVPQLKASSPLGTDDAKCAQKFDKFNAASDEERRQILAQRDEIHQLLAYAVVVNDWQSQAASSAGGASVRGHNIGGVLVDQNWRPVWWERNSNAITCNGTQHGETRIMWSYLEYAKTKDLSCHMIYTSLEPCAMCSGMMAQQKIRRTVYGNTDFGFGKAIERLHEPPPKGIWTNEPSDPHRRIVEQPFPRTPTSVVSASPFRIALDKDLYAFERVLRNGKGIGNTTEYLATESQTCAASVDPNGKMPETEKVGCARKIYEAARAAFLDYPNYVKKRTDPITGEPLAKVEDKAWGVTLLNELHKENEPIYKAAKQFFLDNVTSFYVTLEDHVAAARETKNDKVAEYLKKNRKTPAKAECATNPGKL